MVHYKLYYFNVRGYGESIRLALTYGGLEFEDVRLEKDEWPELKLIDSTIAILSEMPFGQVPVLEFDGTQIPQSLAILRYVSRKVGIAGSTPEEEAMVDALTYLIKDMTTEIRPYASRLRGTTPATPEELEKLRVETLYPARDKFLPMFVKFLKNSGSGYLIGKNLIFVDLLLAEHIFTVKGFLPDYLDNYPEISEHQKRVFEHPKLAKYIAERPVSEV